MDNKPYIFSSVFCKSTDAAGAARDAAVRAAIEAEDARAALEEKARELRAGER